MRYPKEIADRSKLPSLTAALLSHGYAQGGVAKSMGCNVARVFGEVRAAGKLVDSGGDV